VSKAEVVPRSEVVTSRGEREAASSSGRPRARVGA
jgi:hypothetical protein